MIAIQDEGHTLYDFTIHSFTDLESKGFLLLDKKHAKNSEGGLQRGLN